MTNLIEFDAALNEQDVAVAEALGVIFVGTPEEMMSRVVQGENAVAKIRLGSGYLLLKIKADAKHGEFENELHKFGIGRARASELMRVAKFYTALPDDQRAKVFKLGVSKMQLLAGADIEVVQDYLDDPEAGIGELSVRDLRKKLLELEGKLNDANAKIETDSSLISRLKNKEFITKFEHETEAVREECMHLQATCEIGLNGLLRQFNAATESVETSEKPLRIEHAYIAATVVASRALQLVERLRNSGFDLPVRIKGEHILTAEEAERWLHDYPMLENAHGAKQVSREIARENSKDGKRGRKLGSTNKAKA